MTCLEFFFFFSSLSCFSDLVYDFMTMLSKRLTEVDVSTILTILQSTSIFSAMSLLRVTVV